MKKGLIFTLLIISVVLIASGCTSPEEVGNKTNQDKLKVYTSFYPLYYVANQIGGDQIEVEVLIPNGAEVHSYEPSPRKIAALEKSDIFFYNGLGLEPWVDKVVKNLKAIDIKTIKVSESVKLLRFENHNHNEEYSHKEEHNHNYEEYDPHIWLDPINMIKIARLMKEEFVALDSNHKEIYNDNFAKFASEIKNLNQNYKHILSKKKQDYILVSHASFGYLADRYGLKQLAVSGVSPHQEPSPKDLAKLTKEAKKHNIKYIFMETLANPKTAKVLAQEANLEVLSLNPIAGLTAKEKEQGENYISIMKKNLSSLRKALVDIDE